MFIKKLVYNKNNYRDKLLNELRYSIFHLTNYTNFKNIQKDGVIFNNKDKILPLNTSSEGSFGRRKGWICLFNLIDCSNKIIKDELIKYNFLDSQVINSPRFNDNPIYLILNPKYYDEIIQNEFARKNYIINGQPTLYIPFVECWYPSDLPLEKINKVLIVNFK